MKKFLFSPQEDLGQFREEDKQVDNPIPDNLLRDILKVCACSNIFYIFPPKVG